MCVILVTKPPIIISRTLKKNDNAFKRLNCTANYTLGYILTGRLGNCEHSLEPGSFLPTPVCRCRVLAPRESCRSASSCCHCWVSSVPLRRLLAPRISKPRSRSTWLTPRYRSKAVWEKKTKSKNCWASQHRLYLVHVCSRSTGLKLSIVWLHLDSHNTTSHQSSKLSLETSCKINFHLNCYFQKYTLWVYFQDYPSSFLLNYVSLNNVIRTPKRRPRSCKSATAKGPTALKLLHFNLFL